MALKDEAVELIETVSQANISLRLIGGVAVALRCPSAGAGTLARGYRDLDLCGRSDQARRLEAILKGIGFQPQGRFNALNGGQRMMFDHPARKVHLDVFLDALRMCHVLPFKDRLLRHALTLDIADLLLSKLQIVQLTENDVKDTLALLTDYDLGDDREAELIDIGRIREVCSGDWGWFRTTEINLERFQQAAATRLPPGQREAVSERIEKLLTDLRDSPKSTRWRLRAAVGERVRWYELPEDPTREQPGPSSG